MKNYLKSAIRLFALILTTITFGQEATWTIDKSHSSIGFDIDHLVISQTEGTFNEYDATIKADASDFSDATFDITIQAASVDTKNERRDNHLRNADFFNVEKYPTINFKVTEFKKVEGKKYKVIGLFTMHGVTKEVVLDAIFGGLITHPSFGTRAGLRITGALNRYDFGLKYNAAMEAGGYILGEEVRIDCRLEMVKQVKA
ncbi:YceI family protein [uncultured Dokdonia sp.]|uniref:YceI family protein n=1 Tax=uncultured Dokdonia sp. TaxID=575653 RepID=UPI00261D78B0|nr:YceI family protein [uncultured Dokdonia sp.]